MVWVVGQQLQGGKYIIEKVLPEGGFGITYKARHTLLKQLVVIKTPNERLKNLPDYPKYLQRFMEEGQRVAQLSEKKHPNIVRVTDLFKEGEIYCLVMDFVPGESLFDLVRRRGALPPTEAVEYVRQIGEALTVVHQARLVHRDAHPGNIMVQKDGKAILIDFGIAGEILQTVESSKHFGNLAFAPYEQMMGSRELTLDIYCLAASLYYAVTGQPPTSSLEQKLNNFRLIKPNQLANISDELNWAILKGMELEAKNRPQSMQEWLKLLEVANRTVEVSLPPKKRITIPWGWLTRHLLLYAVFGFVSAPSDWARNWIFAWTFACCYALIYDRLWTLGFVGISIVILPLFLVFSSASTWDEPMYKSLLRADSGWVLPGGFVFIPPSLQIWVYCLALFCILVNIFNLVYSNTNQPESGLFDSKFITKLILFITSSLGLGLGWWAYQMFPILR
ncbi:MAG TPA: serine/threonine protein kinase [Cyanobacteria bacterium UBA11369]|nr:serine/threonine protein kinase [Cyanobacteria bacterium UBA11371]HBE31229.1 serine/threonine protein kinase [Cyanobacteria bacterium UBA11368]HBE49095.1 serine/threonine protein kinase [Cyanobacteria bacterium UBA11369]